MPVRRMRPHGIKVFAKLSSESGWKAGETMRTAEWKDYELIDTADGERLERWGDVLLIRPDPQIIWSGEKKTLVGGMQTPDTAVPIPEAENGRSTKRYLLCGKSPGTA